MTVTGMFSDIACFSLSDTDRYMCGLMSVIVLFSKTDLLLAVFLLLLLLLITLFLLLFLHCHLEETLLSLPAFLL